MNGVPMRAGCRRGKARYVSHSACYRYPAGARQELSSVTPDRLQLMVMALPAPGALGYYRPVRVWPGWFRRGLFGAGCEHGVGYCICTLSQSVVRVARLWPKGMAIACRQDRLHRLRCEIIAKIHAGAGKRSPYLIARNKLVSAFAWKRRAACFNGHLNLLSNSFSTNPTCTALRGRRRGSGLRGRLAWPVLLCADGCPLQPVAKLRGWG